MSHDNPNDQPQRVSEPDEEVSGGYGLPTPRDGENNLLPQDHSYEWNGQEVKIKLIPPTISQLEQYQNLGDDVEVDALRDIVDTHVEEPLKSKGLNAGDLTVREVNCYVEGIIDYGDTGGKKMEEVREAIEEREGRSGGN